MSHKTVLVMEQLTLGRRGNQNCWIPLVKLLMMENMWLVRVLRSVDMLLEMADLQDSRNSYTLADL